MKKIALLLGAVILLVGCSTIKQAVSDYNTGKNVPLTNSEVSPADEAAPIANAVSDLPLPFAATAAPIVLFLATGFFTWKRGVAIRKNNGAPVATNTQKLNLWTGILQDAANIFAGAFTTSVSGSATASALQRVWKVALATAASAVSLGLANQSFMNFLTGHPVLDTMFIGLSSGIAGIEKAMSNVPVQASAPAITKTT